MCILFIVAAVKFSVWQDLSADPMSNVFLQANSLFLFEGQAGRDWFNGIEGQKVEDVGALLRPHQGKVVT